MSACGVRLIGGFPAHRDASLRPTWFSGPYATVLLAILSARASERLFGHIEEFFSRLASYRILPIRKRWISINGKRSACRRPALALYSFCVVYGSYPCDPPLAILCRPLRCLLSSRAGAKAARRAERP